MTKLKSYSIRRAERKSQERYEERTHPCMQTAGIHRGPQRGSHAGVVMPARFEGEMQPRQVGTADRR